MATTLIFAELLITGIQVAIWLFILTLSVFGIDWLANFDGTQIKDWQTIIAIIGLSIVYVLGIVFDRLADALFLIWDRKIAKEKYPNVKSFAILRFEIAKDNPALSAQFEYTRSRLRLSRSTAFNFAITTVALIVFGLTRLSSTLLDVSTFITFTSIVGTLLTAISIFAWYRLITQHFNFLSKYRDASSPTRKTKKLPMVKK